MYCSSCGAVVIQGLSYCNRCGANLKPPESSPHSKPVGLAWLIAFGIAMMGTPIGGVTLIATFIKELLDRGIPFKEVLLLAMVMLAMIFGAAVLLARLLSPLVKAYLKSVEPAESKKAELSGHSPAQLEAAREPVSSVTENTTRAFEPVYSERKTH